MATLNDAQRNYMTSIGLTEAEFNAVDRTRSSASRLTENDVILLAQNAKELGWDGRSDFNAFKARTDMPGTTDERRARGLATQDDLKRFINQHGAARAEQLEDEVKARNHGFINQSNQRIRDLNTSSSNRGGGDTGQADFEIGSDNRTVSRRDVPITNAQAGIVDDDDLAGGLQGAGEEVVIDVMVDTEVYAIYCDQCAHDWLKWADCWPDSSSSTITSW